MQSYGAVSSSASRVLGVQRVEERKQARRLSWHVLPPIFLFFVLCGQLTVRVAVTNASYQLEQLRTKALQSDSQLRELRKEYAALTCPAIITDRARQELGLQQLPPQHVRKILMTRR